MENNILQSSPELLSILLQDQSASLAGSKRNILWATTDYECLGQGYSFFDQILPELITGENGHVIMPRILKQRTTQLTRIRKMAEVFTPAWVCNVQNNQIDEQWFGQKDVFNIECFNNNGMPTWITKRNKIQFPNDKNWLSYVGDIRLEITCGEAPYLASRYDLATGQAIPLEMRIGLLDRKLRVVGENTESPEEWSEAAEKAFKSVYAFEWQGDSLLLARESLLFTYIEYFKNKFNKKPLLENLKKIAKIISWNVWQMDGLKGVIPGSCHSSVHEQSSLFDEITQTVEQCEGCQNDDLFKHNGTYCYIMDWAAHGKDSKNSGKYVRYVDLMRKTK